jgi:hypothetical protein
MAANSVGVPDNGDVISITIPEKYAERFRNEAEHNLGTSAQGIYESWKWNTQDRDRDVEPKHPITEREIRMFEDAAHVFRQTREQRGGLNIEGSVKVLQSCVHGVLLDVTQDLQAQAELAEPDFAPVMEESEFWRGVRARLDAAAGAAEGKRE